MNRKIWIVIILISISVFALLFYFAFQDLIFPQSNLVTHLHFKESKYYSVLYGGIADLDRSDYVYPKDRLSYLVVLNKKSTVDQIYINATVQYIIGNTIAETYHFDYLPLGNSTANVVQYPYSFSARQEGTNTIKLILNIYDPHGESLDSAIEETPFQVLSLSNKLQYEQNNYTLASIIITSILTATGVIYAILRGVESSKLDRKQDFAEMLAKFEKDLTEKVKDEKDLHTGKPSDVEKCDRYSSDYLNILDRIAYLREKEMISDDLIDYFDYWFEYGKTFLEWKVMMFGPKESSKWPHQIWWTTQPRNATKIKAYPLIDMPLDMQVLYNEKAGKDNSIKEPEQTIDD